MLHHRAAPAKINLGLHVLRQRPDGFHDLETVFLRIPWADHLTAAPADARSLTCTDPALPTDGTNLVLRAAHALATHTGTDQGAALHLDKRLPYGAGLGSGSSDAATTLRLLVDLWGLDVPEGDLHALAARLGSDVPFFLGPAAAYATGRGQHLTPLRDAHGEPYTLPFTLVVAVPPIHVATGKAYAMIHPHDQGRPDLRTVVATNDLDRWRRELVNDFEAPVFAAHPAIATLKAQLYDAGAGYASLSGSGASVFGVFTGTPLAQQTAEALRQEGHTVWCGV